MTFGDPVRDETARGSALTPPSWCEQPGARLVRSPFDSPKQEQVPRGRVNYHSIEGLTRPV